jgi:hypothetical protein
VNDLIEFLRARLDEDEAVARAATGSEWGAINEQQPYVVFDVAAYRRNKMMKTVGAIGAIERSEDRAFVAQHDPARVMREVEAKRRTVDEYANNPLGFDEWPLFPLFNMVREYADHPDFQSWWAPDLT